MNKFKSIISLIAIAILVTGCQSSLRTNLPSANVTIEFNGHKSRHDRGKILLSGDLQFPKIANGRVPAIVVLHSAGGIDGTGAIHARNFNAAGFATLEIDMFGARGQRRKVDGDLIPMNTIEDVFAALDYLSVHPSIDPKRIGITGYSWGGILSILSAQNWAVEKYSRHGRKYAAHVPYYPVCHRYLNIGYGGKVYGRVTSEADWTGAPMLIIAGARDEYDEPDTCEKVRAALPSNIQEIVDVHIYPEAGHGFDVPKGHERSYYDKNACMGRGCLVLHKRNDAAAEDSLKREVAFFREVFSRIN
jgi:uncharacterized protein